MQHKKRPDKKKNSNSVKDNFEILPKDVVEAINTVAKVSSNINSYVKEVNKHDNPVRKVSVAAVTLLKTAISSRYSKKYRAGIIKDGNLFNKPIQAAYFEENVRSESKSSYIKKSIGIPIPGDSYRKKTVQIGPGITGSFAAIAKGPFHKTIKHRLLDTELDFGNSLNKTSDFRRNELVLKGGFNQKTISFMGTETFLTHEKMLEMITSVNNEYSPDSCSGYWSLLANQSKNSKNTDKLYAGIPSMTTRLTLKSRNPCHNMYVKVNLVKIKEKTKNLDDIICLLFDTETKIEASKRIIESESERATEALKTSKDPEKLKTHCATIDYLYRKINSENCHRPCQSIDREDIYSRTILKDESVDQKIKDLEETRRELPKKDNYPSYIEIEELGGHNIKKRGILQEIFSDVNKFKKGLTITNKDFLENKEFFTEGQIKEYKSVIKSLKNLADGIMFTEDEINNSSTLKLLGQGVLTNHYSDIMQKHIRNLDKLGSKILSNRRQPKNTFINFNVDTSLQLTDYEAFNENCQIVQSWQAELRPNNTYRFDITQNFSHGICINDLLSQVARFDPKHPFGYVIMLEIIGEKGAGVKCLEDRWDYFGYAPTQIMANVELEVKYITQVSSRRFQPEEDGKQLNQAIQLYWDTAVDEDTDKILEEIFYPKRDRTKFNLNFDRLTYDKECTNLDKFFVETFEMILDEKLGNQQVDFDLKDFLSNNFSTPEVSKVKNTDSDYSRMRPSMDDEEEDEDISELDERDSYEA